MRPTDDDGADRAPTLADVAAACGVATSTASRALSTPARVNAQTRERIAQAARELGYVPNAHARALTEAKARSVAVFVGDVTNPFYFGIIRGTQQQLRSAGYAQILVDTEESEALEFAMVQDLRASVDGVILAASRLSDRQLISLNATVPVVAINRRTRGVPCVSIDSARGVEQAVTHLVSLGHSDIVYASGPEGSWSNELRWRSLCQIGETHGITMRRIGPFAPHQYAGAAAADAALNSSSTACIAFNDLLAIGMLSRFKARGIAVPADISLVGCDDIFGSDFCSPALTTLTAPIEQAGRSSVSILLARINRSPGSDVRDRTTLPTHLTIRASTGPIIPRRDV